ncbi:MAG: glycosyltransferase [Lachnospiraceae bacterium]|nr:glycosyltransferase [Lachnospiraceae bacterium]
MKISVITVSYNAAETIAKTIGSVLHQTLAPFEYIIQDGGSDDDTLKIAKSFADDFDRAGIAYTIVSEKDEGIYDAMNKGIARATGDLIGLINADDWYEPIALERVAKAMEEDPAAGMVYGDIRMWKDAGHSFIKHARERKYATSRDWNHPTTFITGELYQKYRYRNETIHDDYDLILRMKKDGVRATVVHEVLANFRMNGISHKRSFSSAMKRAKVKYGIYRQNGYSRAYLIECVGVELAKWIIG